MIISSALILKMKYKHKSVLISSTFILSGFQITLFTVYSNRQLEINRRHLVMNHSNHSTAIAIFLNSYWFLEFKFTDKQISKS